LKTFSIRTITGVLFVAILVTAILLGGNYFFFTFLALICLALYEFTNLMNRTTVNKSLNRELDIAGGIFLFSGLYYGCTAPEWKMIYLAPYLLYLMARGISELYLKNPNPIQSWANSFLGQLYIALPLSLLNIIVYQTGSYVFLLLFFIFIWLNDTGAFLVGCTFGKHRLFERISPKKSWEGFFGGLAFCIISAVLFALYLPLEQYSTLSFSLNLWQWIALGILISVFSTWGDLCESMIKRTLNVKDSGKILPGHGGILDRIDSVLMASPAVVIYLFFVA